MVVGVLVEITSKRVDRIFDYRVPKNLEDKVEIGKRVEVPFSNRTLVGFILEVKNISDVDNLKDIINVLDEEVILTEELLELGKYLKETTLASLISCYQVMLPKGFKASIKGNVNKKYRKVYYLNDCDKKLTDKQREVVELFTGKKKLNREELKNVSSSILNTLVKNNILRVEEEEVYRLDYEKCERKVRELTPLQEAAVNNILNTEKIVSLLYGVTGSGKTEVYMELIDKYLKKGKKSIVLVPEISLTPQLIKRFEERFGSNIALLHSALSDGEKYDEYRRIVRGEVDIVIGARSAVFAPLSNLGLIIIDECHSDSYKQDNNPRYNAKDVAIKRAKDNNAKVVLGSATPMLEEYARGLKDVFNLVTLEKRVNGKELPKRVSFEEATRQAYDGEKYIFVRDVFPKFQLHLFIQMGFFQKTFEKAHMAHADLEFFQADRQQGFNHHGDHLGIRFHAAVPDQLRAGLRRLFQAALIIRMVDKCIRHITQTDRHILLSEIFCRCSGDGRGDIRTKHQRVAFPVKKLI